MRGIPNQIEELRDERNMTAHQLADSARMKEYDVYLIETEKRAPSLREAYQIAQALGEPIEKVFRLDWYVARSENL